MEDDCSPLSVLKMEWDQRFQEKLFHMQRYHRQSDLIKAFLTLVLGVAGFALGSDAARAAMLASLNASFEIKILVLVCSAAFVIVTQNQLYDLIDSFILIFRNAHRIAALEIQINAFVNFNATLWDSRISPSFYGKGKWYELPVRFDKLAPGSLFLLIILFNAAIAWFLCGFWWPYRTIVISTLGLISLINILQLWWVNSRSICHILDRTFEESVTQSP